MQKHEVGIDTLSYYYGLTPKQNKAILNKLKMLPDFFKKGDYWEETHIYHSNYFQRQGVKLIVSQIKGTRWGLLVIIHPALVLGEMDRSNLYQPEKKAEYKSMIKLVDKLLKEVDVPCSVDDMKLYRADVTANFIYDTSASVSEYIRILKKSRLLHNYHWDKFREDDHTARDCKIANQHSCKQYCKSAAFFAYDKTAQLEMIEAFPDALIGKHILRLEAQLRRKAMKKWVGEDTMEDSNWKIIKELGVNVEKILSWYLERVNPVHGNYIRYKDAVELVSQVKGEKKRERMLYLLRKTSDSENLAAAQEKMKEKFQLSDSQCKTVLNQFQKLGIRTPNKTEKQSKRQQGIKKPNGYQLCVHIGRAGACIDGTRQRFAQQPSGAFQDERNCPPHVWQCGALYVSRCTPVCKTENRTLYQREVSEDDKWVSRANFAGRADDPAYIPAFCNHSHWRQ